MFMRYTLPMRMFFYIFCLLSLMAYPQISAAEVIEHPAKDVSLVAVCSLLKDDPTKTENVAGADYVPGVDVHGRKVRSANLNDEGANVPQLYRFYLDIDLAERYIDLPEGLTLESERIPLNISADGKVSLDEQDRTGELTALCKEHYGQATTP